MISTWHRLNTVGALVVGLGLSLIVGGDTVAHEGHGATPETTSSGGMAAHPAHIHQGTCSDLAPEPLYELTNVTFGSPPADTPTAGEEMASAAILVMTSITTLDVALSDLLAGEHVIDVHVSAEDPETALACGAIGGAPTDSGLAIGLEEENDSGHAGIAWLQGNADDTTTITIYVAHGLTGRHAEAEPDATPHTHGAASSHATEVTVELVDITFKPAGFAIPANTDVRVTLTNSGVIPHTFTIDPLDIDVSLAPGETEEITMNAPTGTYEYYCAVPGHKAAGMVGTLTVD